jgi:hypothetical protein
VDIIGQGSCPVAVVGTDRARCSDPVTAVTACTARRSRVG